MDFKSYFQQPYQGGESFIENVIIPVFGENKFEDGYEEDIIEGHPELETVARATGITQILRLGTINIPMNPTDVFDITVSDRVQMERNRVAIQQLVRRIMSTYSSAFMIFHYDDDDKWDWRFSYSSKLSSNKDTTESKRYTFLLGPNQSCRTAAENFDKLAAKGGRIERADIIAAFDVEALSKEFFGKYKEQYEKFCQFVYEHKTERKWFGPEFEAWEDKRVRDYVKRLLGRIVFLHFLQKKGWMGVPTDKEWGEGRQQFMKDLFEHATPAQQANYLDEVLEPMFIDLDTLRDNDIAGAWCNHLLPNGGRQGGGLKVPYLNGGLFEKDEMDEPKSVFPAEYFRALFTFFYQYNFTIDENDPDDAQVGVDPEMLGRIFENLLEDNKDKGAYYTPKEIVQYMCRESLVSYLATASIENGNKNPRDKVEEAIRMLVAKPEEIVPRMTQQHKEDFGKALRKVRICDPAIGSGAFPMGLLNELVRCRAAIDAWAVDANGTLLSGDYAALKSDIVSNSIYGVDIEKGAVDIARLRFWLSIIVDEKTPKALPNLDYKIMLGDSLSTRFAGTYVNLSSNQQHANIVRMREEKLKLYALKQKYYAARGDEKYSINIQIKDTLLTLIALQLGQEIQSFAKDQSLFGDGEEFSFQKVQDKLNSAQKRALKIGETIRASLHDETLSLQERAQTNMHFFDWRIMFTEVFDKKDSIGNFIGGFDIVIGNPPYGAKFTAEEKNRFKENYRTAKTIKGVQKGSTDSYTLFIEKGYNLLSEKGVITYIVPISFTSSDSLEGVHKMLKEKCETIKVSSYSVRPQPVFENAVVNTSIFLCQKTGVKCSRVLSTKMHRKGRMFNLSTLINNLRFADVTNFLMTGRIPKISDSVEQEILRKLQNYSPIIEYVDEDSEDCVYYRTTGGRYFKVVTDYPTGSTKEKPIPFPTDINKSIGCILSSSLSFWFYQIYSNNLDWKTPEILSFPIPTLTAADKNYLSSLFDRYTNDIEANANIRQSTGRSRYNVETFKEYKIGRSKNIIDEIDDYIGPLYGLTPSEIEYIKNYEIEFRLGDEE